MPDWGKVLVATRYQPYLPAHTCESLIGLVQFGMRPGDQRDFVYTKTMHKAANVLVRKLLQTDCDSICFIDSDAIFGTQALEELRSDPAGWEYDVLQAFTVKRGWPPEPMFMVEMMDQPRGPDRQRGTYFTTQIPISENHIYPGEDPYRIAVSLHFTLIRRSLLQHMTEPAGPTFTYWFEYVRDNGEDINFSIKANALGARLGMSTRLKVGHVSEVITGWDTMVDYYDRKFAVQSGESPASMDRIAAYFQSTASLSALVAEYTGETAETVFQRAITGGLAVADRWRTTDPRTPAQVKNFYGDTHEYLYDLIKWNTSPAFQRMLTALAGIHDQYVLEIGGGLGTMSEFLAAHNNHVDYYDLPGVLRDFAAWRFKRLDGRIPAITLQPHLPINGVYDLIVAVDTLEHIHPGEIHDTLESIARLLHPTGTLFAHNNWSQDNDAYPQHFDHSVEWGAFLDRHFFHQLTPFTWRRKSATPLSGLQRKVTA